MINDSMIKGPRVYFYRGAVFFDYWRNAREYPNPYFNNELWRCEEVKAVRIGLTASDKKWFDYDNWYYDGHTFKEFTLFGISIGFSYNYDARPKEKFA